MYSIVRRVVELKQGITGATGLVLDFLDWDRLVRIIFGIKKIVDQRLMQLDKRDLTHLVCTTC